MHVPLSSGHFIPLRSRCWTLLYDSLNLYLLMLVSPSRSLSILFYLGQYINVSNKYVYWSFSLAGFMYICSSSGCNYINQKVNIIAS
jgi:hypothetical protein